MNISEPFIRRPIATSLLMLGILVFGIGAYGLLPVAALPNVDFPTIVVSVNYPGASPDTMASAVATPLEQQFSAIPALDQMTSTSGIGSMSITLQFDLSRNIDAAAGDVLTAINAATGVLPKDLPTPPTYRKTNPADRPVLIYAVHSNSLPIYRVDDYAYTILAQKISTIKGVSEARIFGQRPYATHVQVNPGELSSRGLGFEDVRNALVATSINRPKGTLEGSHQTFTLDTNDQLFNADAYKNVIVAYRNGAPVRMKDIATVTDGVQNPRIGAWYFDTPGEGLAIQRQAGTNIQEVVDTIKAMIPRLEESIPPSVKVDLVSDRSLVVRAAVHDVQFTMLLTIGLVVIVIFVFLRTLWATVIPSMAVPLSLLATFAIMYAVGYSLDNISLMALTISVGFVVDDAIVMIENVVRYIEQGERPFDAALKGAGQIGFTIISITFSLIAVFIPLLFMGGIIGRLFREFAVTVTVAVMASAFISLTLTPVLCSLFLKEHQQENMGRLNRMAEGFFNAVIRGYDRGLMFVFRHQLIALLSTLTLIGVTGYLYVIIPKGFFPEQDTGFIFGQAEARQDISFNAMSDLTHQFVDIVKQDPAVSGVFSFTGASAYNPTENTARVFIQLKPHDQRTETSNQIIQRLRPKVGAVQGAKFFMQSGQDISVGGRLSRTLYQYTLTDNNLDELNHWAPIVEAAMQKAPELQDVASDQQIAAPHIAIEIDRDAVSRLGISPSLIDETLYDAFGQRQVSTIYTQTSQYKVVLEVQPQYQTDPTALNKIYISGPNGAQIPLSAFAHFTSKVQSLSVNHQGQFPAVTLSFNLSPGYAIGQAVEKIRDVQAQLHMPPTVDGAFQGTAQAFQASLSSTPLLVAAAILVVYIVLGMLYESYIHPLTILSALPSAGVGALLALMILHYDLSVIAMIGVILLIGIVKKNAIMMIDFALTAERYEGKSPRDAIHEACLLRFRPIMMTTFAALFGGLPIALGGGAGSELRRPLGIAIVGGLLVSQWLTLYTTPVVYLYLDRLSHWLGGSRRRSRLANALSEPPAQPGMVEDPHGAAE
ncbi:MAG TPA: efflux RND transporter permease subunit [Stellaceae bacterium]|jgi:hydrophobe/amphiphile efflux-1 (HAE1) family protein|nr:efflux RND transporter permease subunit [Stellaceae bacterium]